MAFDDHLAGDLMVRLERDDAARLLESVSPARGRSTSPAARCAAGSASM